MEEELRDNFLTIVDEDNNEYVCEVIDIIEVNDKKYVVVAPDPNDESVVPLRIVTIDGEDYFESVDDEDEFDAIVDYWENMEEEME